MDLMTLAAKLTLDDSGFRSGISNAESAGQNLTGKLSSMTVAVGNIMADVIKKGFSTVKEMVGGAVDAYADYQQLIGGVETLFKKDADKVSAYAKEAYRTAGISANNYMETVTSFSASLLQGLKGDTEQAAEISNMAITDMADNANKMGTDMTSIQTAYQGFAKQNYTMLDNLKLGYGGTREEMLRLVNESGIMKQKVESLDDVSFDQIIQAIHAIQEQMGITGTTAEEADKTISGSAASMKAAWEDLLSAIGGEGGQANLDAAMEKFKRSFGTYMENFIPTLTTTIANSGSLVEAVAGAVASLPEDLLANLGSAALEGGTGIVKGAKNIVHWLIANITNVFKSAKANTSDIEDFGSALGEFLGSTISDLVTNAPAIIDGVFAAGVALAGSFVRGLFGGIFGTDDGITSIFKDADKELYDAIKEAEKSSAEAQGILGYMDDLVKKYGDSATNTEEWAKSLEHLERVMPGATQYIESQSGALSTTIANLQKMREELRKQAIENAKRKALQTKEDAYLELLAQVSVKETEIEMAENEKTVASEKLANWFDDLYKKNGVSKRFADDAEYWQNGSAQALKEEIDRLLKFYATDEGGEKYDENSEEYKVIRAQLHGWAESLTGTDSDIESMRKELGELQTKLAEAQADYERASEALKKMDEAFDSSKESIKNGGSSVMVALDGLAGQIRSVKLPGTLGGNTSPSFINPNFGNYGPSIYPGMPLPEAGHATGMDYVPYDGYRAVLHKGEAIITREENEARRGGMSFEDMEQALTEAIERGMQGMYLNMNGQKVADITTKRTASNISTNEHARTRAMGG